jgi:hypothetical protein
MSNRPLARHNKIQIRRNDIKAQRNENQIRRNKIQIQRNENQMSFPSGNLDFSTA